MTTYIAEIAGKDSIAAIHKIIRERAVDFIIPTIAYTGTEYGDISSYSKSIRYLIECGNNYDISIGETVVLHDEMLWNILCVRYQNQLFSRYSFFTQCIMCHFYTHLLRIPLYLEKNADGIITGERYSHMGKLKTNQHSFTIECFRTLFNNFKIHLVQPLINVEDTSIVEKEINDYAYISSINDVKCILSGNMTGLSLTDNEFLFRLNEYLDTFVKPIGNYLLGQYTKKRQIQFENLDNVIRSCFHE